LWEHRVSGVILAGGGFDQWTHRDELSHVIKQMVKAGVPVVTLSPRQLGVPMFSVDNEEVGRLAAQRLLAEKHERIGVILGPARNDVTQLRHRGIVNALGSAGASYLVEHVDYTTQSGAKAVMSLLSQAPDLTAFIGGSDTIGLGVVEQLHTIRRAIPRDFSVIGVGNTSFARRSTPPLSSVDVELERTGQAALDFLVATARGGPLPPPGDFRPSIVEGDTIGTPRS
jgi:LacI family transcriptional regulator